MTDRQLRELERIGISLAKSAARLRFLRARRAPHAFTEGEERLLTMRIAQVAEVAENGGDWCWIGGSAMAQSRRRVFPAPNASGRPRADRTSARRGPLVRWSCLTDT